MTNARDKHRRGPNARGRGGPDPALDVRRRVKGLFATLKLLALFEKMPAELREQFYGGCYPDPVLVFDPSFPSAEAFGGAYADVHRTVREAFPRATVKLNGFDLVVRDYWGVVLPLATMARRSLSKFDSTFYNGPPVLKSVRMFLEQAAPLLEYVARQDVQNETFTALHRDVLTPLVGRSRLDARLLHGRVAHVRTPRGPRLMLTLYAERSPMKYVTLRDGKKGAARPMHRVGTPNTWNGIEWASWSAETVKEFWCEQLGIKPGEAWPVYVQSHALKQMRARLDVYAYADWAEHWMHQSLSKPKIVERMSGEELLVAFEVQEKRLGYLVVTARDGLVAVRTFLFLTMANTPEGRMLEKKLKLTREEADYLRLRELSRFTQTDLKDDPQLRTILQACGCGQLFELAEEEESLLPSCLIDPTPFAQELKHYVGMAA